MIFTIIPWQITRAGKKNLPTYFPVCLRLAFRYSISWEILEQRRRFFRSRFVRFQRALMCDSGGFCLTAKRCLFLPLLLSNFEERNCWLTKIMRKQKIKKVCSGTVGSRVRFKKSSIYLFLFQRTAVLRTEILILNINILSNFVQRLLQSATTLR